MKVETILTELKSIKKEISFIRDNMVDKDMVLSVEDYEALFETAKAKKEGKLLSLEEVEKELGLS